MITIQEYMLSKSKPKLNMIKATDETIHQIVKDELDRLGHDADLNHIDTSKVTNMIYLFCCSWQNLGEKYNDLNPDISQWDVSNVKDMSQMFRGCENFDQDLSQWVVSEVKDMWGMFWDCKNFDKNLSKWKVGKVENMSNMFCNCEKFNQDISSWDVSNVENMEGMFFGCTKFNQDLSKWNTISVKPGKKFRGLMFYECPIKQKFKPKFK